MGKRKKRNKGLSQKLPSEQIETPRYPRRVESYSGLDPMDTLETAPTLEGTLLKEVLTGRLRTKNPLMLILMGLVGLGIMLPGLCAVIERVSYTESPVEVIEHVGQNGTPVIEIKPPLRYDTPTGIVIIFGLMGVIGVIIWVNILINLWVNYGK